MNPITPERFFELQKEKMINGSIRKEITIFSKKGDPYKVTHISYDYGNGISFFHEDKNEINENENHLYPIILIDQAYESKPETPLDELNEIIEYIGRQPAGDNNGLEYDKLSHFRTKYESQLKELK